MVIDWQAIGVVLLFMSTIGTVGNSIFNRIIDKRVRERAIDDSNSAPPSLQLQISTLRDELHVHNTKDEQVMLALHDVMDTDNTRISEKASEVTEKISTLTLQTATLTTEVRRFLEQNDKDQHRHQTEIENLWRAIDRRREDRSS